MSPLTKVLQPLRFVLRRYASSPEMNARFGGYPSRNGRVVAGQHFDLNVAAAKFTNDFCRIRAQLILELEPDGCLCSVLIPKLAIVAAGAAPRGVAKALPAGATNRNGH